MILSTLVTSQLHFEMCAGLYGHPVHCACRIFEQLALALKNRVCLEFFTVLKYSLFFRISEQLALAWKTEFALKFFTALDVFFTIHRIFEQLCDTLKNKCALKFFTVLNILFTFRIFEQLVLALKNRVCPEFALNI